MYTTSVFYSQIYASLLPDRHSSSYGSHSLVRQYITLPASGRPLGITAAGLIDVEVGVNRSRLVPQSAATSVPGILTT
jgi:hypothetical protein